MSSQLQPPAITSEPTASVLAPMVKKLQLWRKLTTEEIEALLALPYCIEDIYPSGYIIRDGQTAEHSCLLLSGFAFRQKVTRRGRRSINALHMQGDIVDLQNSLLRVADHSVQALSDATIARIPRKAIIDLAFAYPNIGLAMWYDTLVDGSVFREWILNTARRDAQTRIAHLFCECGLRLETLGLGARADYDFPFTQEQLGDATGLTPVHINRSLKGLEERGLITRTKRHIVIGEWSALKRAGEFDESYLHLPAGE